MTKSPDSIEILLDENNQLCSKDGVSRPTVNQTHVQLVESNHNKNGLVLIDPEQVGKMHDPQDLVQLALQVQKAESFVRANATNKLRVIADQMRHLQQQAVKILEDAQRDDALTCAACNLVKKPGCTYHYYERSSGQKYLSLLSPDEWGESCPHNFLGSYRLEHDYSWTPVEQVKKNEEKHHEDVELLQSLLQTVVPPGQKPSERFPQLSFCENSEECEVD